MVNLYVREAFRNVTMPYEEMEVVEIKIGLDGPKFTLHVKSDGSVNFNASMVDGKELHIVPRADNSIDIHFKK